MFTTLLSILINKQIYQIDILNFYSPGNLCFAARGEEVCKFANENLYLSDYELDI